MRLPVCQQPCLKGVRREREEFIHCGTAGLLQLLHLGGHKKRSVGVHRTHGHRLQLQLEPDLFWVLTCSARNAGVHNVCAEWPCNWTQGFANEPITAKRHPTWLCARTTQNKINRPTNRNSPFFIPHLFEYGLWFSNNCIASVELLSNDIYRDRVSLFHTHTHTHTHTEIKNKKRERTTGKIWLDISPSPLIHKFRWIGWRINRFIILSICISLAASVEHRYINIQLIHGGLHQAGSDTFHHLKTNLSHLS